MPRLLAANSPAHELEIAVETVGEWLRENDGAGESIGILVRTEQAADSVLVALAEAGIVANFVADKSVPAGAPVIMTMHRAKGMEFSRVLIVGAGDRKLPAPFLHLQQAGAERADILQREKSLLYVAATRARDELAIVWSGAPSELLPDLPGMPLACERRTEPDERE